MTSSEIPRYGYGDNDKFEQCPRCETLDQRTNMVYLAQGYHCSKCYRQGKIQKILREYERQMFYEMFRGRL